MRTRQHNIVTYQGSTVKRIITCENPDGSPIDFTGWIGRGMVRVTPDATDKVDWTVTLNANNITCILTAVQTTAMVAGNYVYDIEIQSPAGDVYKPIAGCLTLRREITR